MKRILFVMYNALNKGGIQNVIMNIVRALKDDYVFDALVLSSKDEFYDSEFLSYGGVIVKNGFHEKNRVLNRFKFYLRGNFIKRSVRKMIKQYGPYAAIHCNIADEAGLALKAAKKCGVPIRIAHAHTAFDRRYNPIAKVYTAYLKKLIYKNATNLVACSKKAGEKLYGENNYKIIYNTVDKKFLEFSGERGINDSPVLLQVGMICDNKNQLFSVQVLAELKKKYPNARLTFIGEPKDNNMQKYFDNVKKECVKAGVFDAVSFLPADSDVLGEMRKSDYVIFPSKFEGLGIVPIEAQFAGIKCFVSDTVSTEVDCGGCVFLNLNNGAKVWAAKIAEQFEKDNGEREKYDTARFTPDVIMEQYRKLYNGELI